MGLLVKVFFSQSSQRRRGLLACKSFIASVSMYTIGSQQKKSND